MPKNFCEALLEEIALYRKNLCLWEEKDFQPLEQTFATTFQKLEEEDVVSVYNSIKNALETNPHIDKKKFERYVRSAFFFLNDLVHARLRELKDTDVYHEYEKAVSKVNTENISGYSLMRYPHLLSVAALCPGTNLPAADYLGENFSAACRDKYAQIAQSYSEPADHLPQAAIPDQIPATSRTIDLHILGELKWEIPENEDEDELFPKAVEIAIEAGEISTDLLQRKLRISYARAGRVIDEMENKEIVGPINGSRMHNVLITQNDEIFQQIKQRSTMSASSEKSLNLLTFYSEDEDDLLSELFLSEAGDLLRFSYSYFSDVFLRQLESALAADPHQDLPELIMTLREDEIIENAELAKDLLSFRTLYRQTEEEKMTADQAFFAQKQMEQEAENAQLQRLAIERQSELDREAEAENARMIAAAERQRAAAERERANAERDRAREADRQARRDREAAAQEAERKAKREEENRNHTAWVRCNNCIHNCSMVSRANGAGLTCGRYTPRR